MHTPYIDLDGTTLEGGGQLVRLAVGLSALIGTPIRITDVRGKRSGGGGLKGQHLTSVNWLGLATEAILVGNQVKSKGLTFTPYSKDSSVVENTSTQLSAGERQVIHIRQITPGAISLVLQAVLPFLTFRGHSWVPPSSRSAEENGVRLCITGGTNVSFAPSYEYLTAVLFPTLALIGMPLIKANLVKRGWSHGGAEVGSIAFDIPVLGSGACLPSFDLDVRGEVEMIEAYIVAPLGMHDRFTEYVKEAYCDRLMRFCIGDGHPESRLKVFVEDSKHKSRMYLLLVAVTTTGCRLGRDHLLNKKVVNNPRAGQSMRIIKEMVQTTTSDLLAELDHGGCVDEYTRDQLIVFQALAQGKSYIYTGKDNTGKSTEPSLHTETAIWVAQQLLGLSCNDDETFFGIGLRAGEIYAERCKEDDRITKELGRLAI